jgi:hypothetical protein
MTDVSELVNTLGNNKVQFLNAIQQVLHHNQRAKLFWEHPFKTKDLICIDKIISKHKLKYTIKGRVMLEVFKQPATKLSKNKSKHK